MTTIYLQMLDSPIIVTFLTFKLWESVDKQGNAYKCAFRVNTTNNPFAWESSLMNQYC